MSQTKLSFPSIYNPANQTEEEVLSNFVIRLSEFEELFSAIKKDKMKKPPQHYMIQGQRGYGKTTLLLRLKIEVKNDKDLTTWLIPVMFDEETYSVQTLAKLWEEVIDILEFEDKSFEGLTEKIDELYDTESPEEELYNLLAKSLKERNKKIVLLLDNFGDITRKFDKRENQRLREVLITSNDIRIIGASSDILEFYYEYKQPFFDFFKFITLDELNKDEVVFLLKKLSETYKTEVINQIIENQPERVDSLRRLTGGVPRTIVLLFQIFADDINGDSFKDLEKILDQVTPFYKDRLDRLSIQQQAIIDAIAQNWDAISTREISKKVRMPSKAVSSQLNQLEKSQLITKIPTSTKNQLYQIKERFFNIYYLMRLGRRKNRNKILWLIKFFEIMCGEKELIDRARIHIKRMREGITYDKHAFYISQALARTHIPPDLQHELISETKRYLSAMQSEYIKEICKSHFEIWGEVKQDVINERYDLSKRKLKDDGMDSAEIPFAIAELTRTERQDFKLAIKFYEEAISKGYNDAMFNLALMYENEYKDFKQAEKYYLMASEKGNSSAMNNLARFYYYELKNTKRALEYALLAIEKGNDEAMKGLAIMYENEFLDFKNAEKYYLMAVEKGNSSAMFNLALLYETELKDFKQAEKYYLMAVEKSDSDAMFNLALMYENEYKDFKQAEKYYLMAVEKGDSVAMYNLALMYQRENKDFKQAEKYYLMAVEKGNSGAMYNLALMHQRENKDFNQAEKYYLMAVEKGDSGAMNNLALLYSTEFKDFKQAEKYYLMAVEKGNSGAMNNLSNLYFDLQINKTKALELQSKAFETKKEDREAFGYMMILLWNDLIEDAASIYKIFFENENSQKDVNEMIFSALLMFLVKKQYHYVYNLFVDNKFDIKDKYKPIYYATLNLLGDKYSNEFKKMPPEIKETVEELIKEINQMSIDYK